MNLFEIKILCFVFYLRSLKLYKNIKYYLILQKKSKKDAILL